MTEPLVMYAGASPLGLGRYARDATREAVRRFHHVREAAPTTLERTVVREATMGATSSGPGRMLLRLITAGVSLNGNAYPANVLREAAQSRAWPRGTKAYVDHATPDEEESHPSGSVKNLAAVLTEDARWDEATQSLVAEARLFEPWRGPLTEMAKEDAIGMSIRAWVSGVPGTFEGRECFVVEKIEGGRSVDFVTVPAAGGGIISVLEAAGSKPVAETATLGGWLESRLHLALTQYADDMYGDGQLTRDERITLSSAIGDGLQAWTSRVEADAPQLFQRSRWDEPQPAPKPVTAVAAEASPTGLPADEPAHMHNVTDGAPPPASEEVALIEPEEEPVSGSQTGAPPEQAGTVVVPDTGQQPTATTEAVVQPTAESFAATLAAAVAEAVRPLQQQLADLNTRESQRDAADRADRNRRTAAEAVTVALRAAEHADVAASISGRVNARVTAAVPTAADGTVDQTALGELITTVVADEATHVRRERANALAEAGVGLPYGLGGAPVEESTDDDGFTDEMTRFFSQHIGMSAEAAAFAAKGR